MSTVGKIAIVIIGYNSLKFLKPCLDALKKQTMLKDLDIVYLENASYDGSIEFIDKHYDFVRTIQNTQNIGYTGAANQGVEITTAPYVMILNPDLIMEPDYLEKVYKEIEENPAIGVIQGKFRKYDFENMEKTDFLDSTGLIKFKSTRIHERGQGELDEGQYDQEGEVFGVGGAGPLYRRATLEDVKIMGEYQDKDFFMYKEDCDLAWRINMAGWKSYYMPKAISYHGRGTGVHNRNKIGGILKNRGKLSAFQKKWSFRNHRLMQIKNVSIKELMMHLPWILAREISHFGYTLLREPKLLLQYFSIFKLAPKMFKKRKEFFNYLKSGKRHRTAYYYKYAVDDEN